MYRLSFLAYMTPPSGNVAVFSQDAGSVSVTYQPHPRTYGTRTTSPVDIDLSGVHCATCDRGAPTEYCYHDDGVCVALSDTSVHTIEFQDGSLEANTYHLDGCTPRYLQSIHTTEFLLVCRESCFQLVSRVGSTLTLHDLTCGEGQGGIVVEALTPYGLHSFLVELDGNYVISTDHSFMGHPMDITPTDCTEPLSLHPIFTRDQFILRCRTNNGGKVYFLHPYDFSEESLSLDSDPMSSPDGRTFATVSSNTTLRIYNIDDLEQYPGVKDFGIAITFCTYLDSDTLIVVLDGSSQVLVHVLAFLDSAGADGLTALPYTSSVSNVHKLITSDVYATYNRTGSVYNIQLFNISNGQALEPASNLVLEPLDVFFVPGTGLPPPTPQPLPPLALHPSPSPSSTSLPAPSTSELSSSLPSETAAAEPPGTAELSTSTDEEPSSQNDTSVHCSHGCRVAVVVAAVLAAAMLVAAVLAAVIISRALWKSKYRVKGRGPYGQATDLEKGIIVKLCTFSWPRHEPSPSSSGATTPSTDNSGLQSIRSQLVPGTL